jgi:hypothetical protein
MTYLVVLRFKFAEWFCQVLSVAHGSSTGFMSYAIR